ncbi:hypothetical protein [Flavobacterium silvaticum]|uniref:Uncharacterized protein n=1 Tax=Flavobacterium silvaticum TaxID=1852020 RepID=A0A972FVC6_9FLAO|nr:hypothetical protein [Flavobacterium silvaticum]NMH28295.1 hypothetical protein [Flavobacterium silvaticum]
MTADYSHILDALIKQGFHQIPESNPETGKKFDYRITAYSLNTKLSFRFESLEHFVEFLKLSDADSEKRIAVLQTRFTELGLDPNQFFWVNFFEEGKEKEM